MTWTKYLDDAQLKAVRDAAIGAGLATPEILTALKGRIPPQYTGYLQGDGLPPNLRLYSELQQMNLVHNLVSGEVPLALFISAMAEASGDAGTVSIFQTALSWIEERGRPPQPAAHQGLASEAVAMAPVTAPGLYLTSANTKMTPEAQIGEYDQTLEVGFLQRGVAATKSVFKIVVKRHFVGQQEFISDDKPRMANGTGWVIAPGLGITNHHVINARSSMPPEPPASSGDFTQQAETAQVYFDFFDVAGANAGYVLGPGTLLASDAGLDFALLRLPAGLSGRTPLRLRRNVVTKQLAQPLGIGVNVLQHPNGSPMRIGFRNNFVVLGDSTVLAYLTDTDGGSSGSPVLDDDWKVAALHHGTRGVSDQNLTLMGRLVRRENVGTPLPTLMAHLADKHPALHQEIETGQLAPAV